MRAAVIYECGGPEVLRVIRVKKPIPLPGEVLIRVRAFGITRIDLYRRSHDEPSLRFPRILGMDAVGEVEIAPGGEYAVGSIVATVRELRPDEWAGTYVEYLRVPVTRVALLKTSLSWTVLGAMPMTFQAACGSLAALQVKPGEDILIRGGTTSVGLAATAMARYLGVYVAATSRYPMQSGLPGPGTASSWIEDCGIIAPLVAKCFPGKFDKVLDLVGYTTLIDSMNCVREGGIACLAGTVGGFDNVPDVIWIPAGVSLKRFWGGWDRSMQTEFQSITDCVADGRISVPVGPSFPLEKIADAHRFMEKGYGWGRVVITLE